MAKVRKGPKCASIGLAQDAFTGVKQSSTFLPPGPAADRWGLVRGQVVQDDQQPVAASMADALVLADHAPQPVITQE